jgi:hypothetical protein
MIKYTALNRQIGSTVKIPYSLCSGKMLINSSSSGFIESYYRFGNFFLISYIRPLSSVTDKLLTIKRIKFPIFFKYLESIEAISISDNEISHEHIIFQSLQNQSSSSTGDLKGFQGNINFSMEKDLKLSIPFNTKMETVKDFYTPIKNYYPLFSSPLQEDQNKPWDSVITDFGLVPSNFYREYRFNSNQAIFFNPLTNKQESNKNNFLEDIQKPLIFEGVPCITAMKIGVVDE